MYVFTRAAVSVPVDNSNQLRHPDRLVVHAQRREDDGHILLRGLVSVFWHAM